jgi:hypothetical protein
MEDYVYEDAQNHSTEQTVKINNTVEWSNLTIKKMYEYNTLQGVILDDIKVLIDGITIIDGYNPITHKYIPVNTNTSAITLEKNNFASKEDLIKILEFFE